MPVPTRLPISAVLLSLLLGAAPAHAQGLRALFFACRSDCQRFCAGVPRGDGRIMNCLREHGAELSHDCASAIRDAGTEIEATIPDTVRVERDIAYGPDAAQRIDVYAPAGAEHAPVLLLVHGGGWRRGDKTNPGVVTQKVVHWAPKGFVVISVNYRMLPAAAPKEQANDVARALAFALQKAAAWGADPARFVAVGHSAGAHLVSLLAADPGIAKAVGARPWLGTVALDSGAMDVVAIMENRHLPLYDQAFGSNPAYWRAVSPVHQLVGKPKPMLLVCSSRRAVSCEQAKGFAAKAKEAGGSAEVLPVDLSHMQINGNLGDGSEYTAAVDAFVDKLVR